MRADPPFMYRMNRQWVQMVPTLSSTSLYNDQISGLEHLQVLHNCTTINFGKMRAERARGEGLITKVVKDLPPHGRSQRLKDRVDVF